MTFVAGSVSLEVAAIVLTLVAHLLGGGVLVVTLIDGEKVDWRGTLWPRDDDGDGGSGPEEPVDRDPRPGGGIVAPPLPEAGPSAVRLREPGRIGDGYPRPVRRPAEHPPERPRIPQRD